jgi:NAD(P)-dependent dehydrogenase (short-subunit alcohol dehydrogenase family)
MMGNNVVAVRADVSKMSDLDNLYTQIGQEKNRLDIVFANAGVGRPAPMGSITEEDFDWTFGINVKGFYLP